MDRIPAETGRSSLGKSVKPLVTLPNVSLLLSLVCCALSGVLGAYADYMSYVLLVLFIVNWNKKEFFLFSAIVLFFGQRLCLFRGVFPLSGAYACLLTTRFVFDFGKIRFRPQFIPAAAVMIGYCLLAIGRNDVYLGLTRLLGILLCFLTASTLRQDANLFRKMTVVFPLSALCAGVSAAVPEEMVIAACLYCAALGMVLCSDEICGWYFRLPLIAALIYVIAASGNTPAMLMCAVVICVFVVLRYKLKGVFAVVIGCCSVVLITNFIKINIHDIALENYVSKWDEALEYYKGLPFLFRLIGGNISYECNILLYFGAIGATIICGTRFTQTAVDIYGCITRKNSAIPEDVLRAVVLCAAICMVYILASGTLMDWRILFLFFM